MQTLDFTHVINTFVNKKNPQTNKFYNQADTVAATGYPPDTLSQLFSLVVKMNADKVEEEGRIATTQEVLDAWNVVHGGQVAILTPFGSVAWQTSQPATDKPLGEWTYDEAVAFFSKLMVKP